MTTVKLCECGCGQPTPLATKTSAARGHIKGQPKPYVDSSHSLGRPARDLRERFYSHVAIGRPDECWPWTGAIGARGYGRFRLKVDGRRVTRNAHRVALELEGVDLTTLQANHHCDNPGCCNPRHLYAGTHEQNMADMVNRGRVSHHSRRRKVVAA